MRKQNPSHHHRHTWDGMFPEPNRDWHTVMREEQAAGENSPEKVLGQAGLVLVVVLGIVLAINSLLVVFHIH